jgi:hypothetical protein
MTGTPKSNDRKELFVWGCKGMPNNLSIKDTARFFSILTLAMGVF